MNSEQAKKLSLPDIMSRLGYEPTEITKGGAEYWYCSPFRKEKEPSFHTSYLGGKWIWNDFADSGGTVIDFVMRHEGHSKVSDALQFLESLYRSQSPRSSRKPDNSLFSFQQQSAPQARQLEFIEAREIENPAIMEYLTEKRKISGFLARKYLKEIRYRNLVNGKEYFAFGMQNRAGGYEIRSAQDDYPFKSALITRDITIIRGFRSGNGVVDVFEGMTDFLSLLTMMKTDCLAGDCIVMHSLSSYNKASAFIKEKGYSAINTFLDNNKSGREHTEKFIEDFGAKVASQSDMFLSYEDVNDMLKDECKSTL
ncbi:MAG: toprim domain-containing protein [Phaeodactylibacter sp.]|nr:toprim domain-containing protein [Phaeodactylibacter sp.]